MKRWFVKFISCFLTIAILVSTIEISPQVIVYADDRTDYLSLDDAAWEAVDECNSNEPRSLCRITPFFSTHGC